MNLSKYILSNLKEADCGCYEPLIAYMIEFGGQDAPLSEILGHIFFKMSFQGKRLISLVKAYLRRGYNTNETVNNGHQPLNIAVQNGQEDVALLLVEYGADTTSSDRSGLIAFEWALTRELYQLAFEIYQRGHPYTPRHPNPLLKVPHPNLYKLDMQYFS